MIKKEKKTKEKTAKEKKKEEEEKKDNLVNFALNFSSVTVPAQRCFLLRTDCELSLGVHQGS